MEEKLPFIELCLPSTDMASSTVDYSCHRDLMVTHPDSLC